MHAIDCSMTNTNTTGALKCRSPFSVAIALHFYLTSNEKERGDIGRAVKSQLAVHGSASSPVTWEDHDADTILELLEDGAVDIHDALAYVLAG